MAAAALCTRQTSWICPHNGRFTQRAPGIEYASRSEHTRGLTVHCATTTFHFSLRRRYNNLASRKHYTTVRHSLTTTDETICSIFVNPAQFAPTEDLSKYPRTLEADLVKMRALEAGGKRVAALFLPGVQDLYPDGIEQDVTKQRGTFVDVVGFSQEVSGTVH